MAAPVIESFTDITEGTDTTSFNVTKPTGLAVGDLLLALIAKDDSASMSPPSGWTTNSITLSGSHGLWIMYKVADSGDVAASNFNFTGDSEQYVGRLYRISGIDTTTPIDVIDTTGVSGTSGGAGTDWSIPSVTTVTNDALAFAVSGMDDDDDPYVLTTTGWTEDRNAESIPGSGNNGTAGILVAYKVITTAGSTGAVLMNQNAAEGYAATQFAIRPQSGLDIVKIRNETENVDETTPRSLALARIRDEDERSQETSVTAMALARVLDEVENTNETSITAQTLVRITQEVMDLVEDAQITKAISQAVDETLNIQETTVDVLATALLKIISEVQNINETTADARTLARALLEIVQTSETTEVAATRVRVLIETESASENIQPVRTLSRVIAETMNIIESLAKRVGELIVQSITAVIRLFAALGASTSTKPTATGTVSMTTVADIETSASKGISATISVKPLIQTTPTVRPDDE